MADSDNPKLEVEYVVTTSGDGSKQTAEGIKAVKAAAGEAAPATKELNKAGTEAAEVDKKHHGSKKELREVMSALKREIPELGAATKELNKAGTEAAEVDEKHHGSKKELREVMSALKREIPELGAALHLLKSPYAALVRRRTLKRAE